MIRIRHTVVALAAALLSSACSEPPAAPLHQHEHQHQLAPASASAGAPMSDALKQIRQKTARFHSTEQAIAAGYVPTDHCVASPEGGMGMHWGNRNLIDPYFDPSRPEVLLYEPRPNGQPKLVAVEYVVLDVGQQRPSLDGHLFDIRGTPDPRPHWSLHVWLYRDNPNGIFTPFNPMVSCS
jgi:hypothetical protein